MPVCDYTLCRCTHAHAHAHTHSLTLPYPCPALFCLTERRACAVRRENDDATRGIAVRKGTDVPLCNADGVCAEV